MPCLRCCLSRILVGIGKDYIIIKSADDIKVIDDDRSLVPVRKTVFCFTGIRMLSSAGNIVGIITDYVMGI